MLRFHFTEKEITLIREVEEFSPHMALIIAREIVKQKEVQNGQKANTPSPQK